MTLRIALAAAGIFVVGACTGGGDEAYYHSYCQDRGIEEGTAQFTQCVAAQRAVIERERARTRTFRPDFL